MFPSKNIIEKDSIASWQMTGVCYNNIVPETKSRNKMRYGLFEIFLCIISA